jgi:hypothetical protein
MTAGRTNFDWEADLGFLEPEGNDSWVGDLDLQAFKFKKDWGAANLELVLGRVDDDLGALGLYEYYLAAALANFDINEKFRIGALGYFYWSDYEPVGGDSDDGYTAAVYAGFRFHPSVELKGIVYFQNGDGVRFDDDSSNAWKAIIDIDQDLLKFTSLWLEYAQIDNNFVMDHFDADLYPGPDDILNGGPLGTPGSNNTTKLFLVNAQQKWNDKWSSYLRYAHWDFDLGRDDTLNEFTAGVKYQFTDAMSFELSYDALDADANVGVNNDKDHLVRFRTFVSF